MVKENSDSERKPAAATWGTLSDSQQGFFYMHHPTDRITHTTGHSERTTVLKYKNLIQFQIWSIYNENVLVN